MNNGAPIARMAALVADPSRSMMLGALMGGMALTANELADEAGVAPSTASSHLAILRDAGLIEAVRQGRHRYFRLASEEVAAGLEALGAIAVGHADGARRPGPSNPALRAARICYDHFAGTVGVRIYKSMVASGGLRLGADGVTLSETGQTLLDSLGVARVDARNSATRLCLDWSERTYHLGGPAAASILRRFLDQGWARRGIQRRQLDLTPSGNAILSKYFNVPSVVRLSD